MKMFFKNILSIDEHSKFLMVDETLSKLPLGYTVLVPFSLEDKSEDKLPGTFVCKDLDTVSKVLTSVNETFSKQSLGYSVIVQPKSKNDQKKLKLRHK